MSGLAVLVDPTGATLDPSVVHQVARAIHEHVGRAPTCWDAGSVVMLRVTPAPAPVTSADGATVVVDGRLDDTESLVAALGQTLRADLRHGPDELAAAARLRWGERFLDHLLGTSPW